MCSCLNSTLPTQIVKLDPTAYEWHYQFGNWLRFLRRRTGQDFAQSQIPTEEELTTLWETYAVCEYPKFEPDDPKMESTLSNMALAGLCQGLAEIIRSRQFGVRSDFPVVVGGLEFQDESCMVDFVLDNIKK